MAVSKTKSILYTKYPAELVDNIINGYTNALKQYRKKEWQYSGNEIGQFIENCRRIIEFETSGSYTALHERLPTFQPNVLTQYENSGSNISESYRIIIPRILFSMYCIRNKRGMIHANHINPNKMDASVLLYKAKWVLSELIRLYSNLTFDETNNLVDAIMDKEIDLIWDTGNNLRILDPSLPYKDQILCLLYAKNKLTDSELINATEYSNPSRFKDILQKLHKERLIEYDQSQCILSPLGEKHVATFLSQTS